MKRRGFLGLLAGAAAAFVAPFRAKAADEINYARIVRTPLRLTYRNHPLPDFEAFLDEATKWKGRPHVVLNARTGEVVRVKAYGRYAASLQRGWRA